MAGASVDLVGAAAGEWLVTHKAAAQNRVRMWTAAHTTCGTAVDLPQTLLQAALKGKSTLPPCTSCAPVGPSGEADVPAISHGMHLACGTVHLVGTACPDGVRRAGPGECKHGLKLATCFACGTAAGMTVQSIPATPTSAPGAVVRPISDPHEPKVLLQGGRPVSLAVGPGADVVVTVPPSAVLDPAIPPSWDLADLPDGDDFNPVLAAAFAADHIEILAPKPLLDPVREIDVAGDAAFRKWGKTVAEDGFMASGQGSAATCPEPVAVAADRVTPVVFGRVDRLDEPQDILDVIRRACAGSPRSAQLEVGPSEMGGCERQLGYRMLFGKAEDSTPKWLPFIGTAVHALLDAAFAPEVGWTPSYRVTGPVPGTLDLYGRKTVVDFKVVGVTTLRKAIKGQISDRYEVQLDLYALGLVEDGHEVENVALLFLPRNGPLDEAAWYSRPWSRERAEAAIARRDRIRAMGEVAEPATVLAALSVMEDNCGYCPVLKAGMCPGVGMEPPAPAIGWSGPVAQLPAPPPGMTA